LEQVSEEDICEVVPEIGVPIAEKFSYVSNEELSEMYAELLAKASQKSQANLAHPSFVNIINNISPDEAVLLKTVRTMPSDIPFVEVRFQLKTKKEYMILNPIFMELSCLPQFQYSDNVHAYVSNLEGLGLLRIRQDIWLASEKSYETLENYAKNTYAKIEKQVEDKKLSFKRGKIEITPFAKLLLTACFTTKTS
jgi:hypothetical protein